MTQISALDACTGERQGLDPRPMGMALRECRTADAAAVARAARELLIALGADLHSEGLRETPRRMATAYLELLTPEPFSMTTFPNGEGYDELVVVREIPFRSLCMHHVLPFLRGGARRLSPRRSHPRPLQARPGVGVVLEAEHLCMSLRGVQKPGAKTVTSALHGLVRDDPRTREEFLSLTGGSRR